MFCGTALGTAGTTRLLITHQRQYLPACDLILVMAGGRIVDRGTYAELASRGVAQVVVAQGGRAIVQAIAQASQGVQRN